jgi:polyisoprenyl-phosphate glycosyltransferase
MITPVLPAIAASYPVAGGAAMAATAAHGSPARPLVSIVAPFFNEGEGVDIFFDRMQVLASTLPKFEFEFVCVDDGSGDDTLARLMYARERSSRVTVVELSRNFGKEAALTAGIDAAAGAAVIPMDADLQDPPDLIAELLERWQAGFEVVLARRANRSADGLLKRSTAAMFYRAHNSLSSVKIPENVGDFRLMDRAVVDALRQLPERQRFMKGLFAWVGFRTDVVEYVRPARAVGSTKFSGFKLWNLAVEGITSFSIAPLKIWTYVGAVGALLTSSYALYIVVRTLIMGIEVPGYASLVVAVLFMGSVQLISVGLLGEYIGRIYLESKQRPVYVVRRRHGAEGL